MRKTASAALAGTLVAIWGSAALAKSGGMPQLNPADMVPQLVWLAIAFVALYLVMSKLAIPAIGGTLAARQGRIDGDLAAAEQANAATRDLVASSEKRLADAREEARRTVRERADADQATANARQAETQARLNARIAEAEKRIEAQRAEVMSGLGSLAAGIAADMFAKVSGRTADAGALAAEVATALKGGTR